MNTTAGYYIQIITHITSRFWLHNKYTLFLIEDTYFYFMCRNVLTECIIFISYHEVPARSEDNVAVLELELQTVVNYHMVARNPN